jgi:hypothetical protein
MAGIVIADDIAADKDIRSIVDSVYRWIPKEGDPVLFSRISQSGFTRGIVLQHEIKNRRLLIRDPVANQTFETKSGESGLVAYRDVFPALMAADQKLDATQLAGGVRIWRLKTKSSTTSSGSVVHTSIAAPIRITDVNTQEGTFAYRFDNDGLRRTFGESFVAFVGSVFQPAPDEEQLLSDKLIYAKDTLKPVDRSVLELSQVYSDLTVSGSASMRDKKTGEEQDQEKCVIQ